MFCKVTDHGIMCYTKDKVFSDDSGESEGKSSMNWKENPHKNEIMLKELAEKDCQV